MGGIKIIKERPNKFVLKYGRTIDNIAMLFGVSKATIYNWLKNDSVNNGRAWFEQIEGSFVSDDYMYIDTSESNTSTSGFHRFDVRRRPAHTIHPPTAERTSAVFYRLRAVWTRPHPASPETRPMPSRYQSG